MRRPWISLMGAAALGLAIGLPAVSLGAPPTSAQAGDVTCSGVDFISTPITGNLTVASGSECFVDVGVTIGGSITVQSGGDLFAGGISVGTGITATSPDAIAIGSPYEGGGHSTIGGSISIDGISSQFTTSIICDAAITGDLSVTNTSALSPEPVIGDTQSECPDGALAVGGNGTFTGNASGIDISQNNAANNGGSAGFANTLTVSNNGTSTSPAPAGTQVNDNSVGVACSESSNFPYTGAGNTGPSLDSCNSTNNAARKHRRILPHSVPPSTTVTGETASVGPLLLPSSGHAALAQTLGTATCPGTSPAGTVCISGSMEGNLAVTFAPTPDILLAGFSATITGSHVPIAVQVSNITVSFNIPANSCNNGATNPAQFFTMTIPAQNLSFSASPTSWLPTGNQASASSYQGRIPAVSGVCTGGTGATSYQVTSAVFQANVGSTNCTNTVAFRFHYHNGGPTGTVGTGSSWSSTTSGFVPACAPTMALAYYDNERTPTEPFPTLNGSTLWQPQATTGSNTTFVGCETSPPFPPATGTPCPQQPAPSGTGTIDLYDGGALLLGNPSTSTKTWTVQSASVTIGACVFRPWGADGTLTFALAPGHQTILTQTGATNGPWTVPPTVGGAGCNTIFPDFLNENLDTSESIPVTPTPACAPPDTLVPLITSTVRYTDGFGVVQTVTHQYSDSATTTSSMGAGGNSEPTRGAKSFVLNTGQTDPGCANLNETSNWVVLSTA